MSTKVKQKKARATGEARWREIQIARRKALRSRQAHTLTVVAPPRWFHDVAKKIVIGEKSGDGDLVLLSVALLAAAQRNGVVCESVVGTLRPVRRAK